MLVRLERLSAFPEPGDYLGTCTVVANGVIVHLHVCGTPADPTFDEREAAVLSDDARMLVRMMVLPQFAAEYHDLAAAARRGRDLLRRARGTGGIEQTE
jgi:hypothetical protein